MLEHFVEGTQRLDDCKLHALVKYIMIHRRTPHSGIENDFEALRRSAQSDFREVLSIKVVCILTGFSECCQLSFCRAYC